MMATKADDAAVRGASGAEDYVGILAGEGSEGDLGENESGKGVKEDEGTEAEKKEADKKDGEKGSEEVKTKQKEGEPEVSSGSDGGLGDVKEMIKRLEDTIKNLVEEKAKMRRDMEEMTERMKGKDPWHMKEEGGARGTQGDPWKSALNGNKSNEDNNINRSQK